MEIAHVGYQRAFFGLAGIFLSHAQKVTARLFTLLVVLLSFEHGSDRS